MAEKVNVNLNIMTSATPNHSINNQPNEILTLIFEFVLFEKISKVSKRKKYVKNKIIVVKKIEGYKIEKNNVLRKLLTMRQVCSKWKYIVENIFFSHVSPLCQIRDYRNPERIRVRNLLKFNQPPCELIINKFIRDYNYNLVLICFNLMKETDCVLFNSERCVHLVNDIRSYIVKDPLTMEVVIRDIKWNLFPLEVAREAYNNAMQDNSLPISLKENARLILQIFLDDNASTAL
jgi:hypothetical protein